MLILFRQSGLCDSDRTVSSILDHRPFASGAVAVRPEDSCVNRNAVAPVGAWTGRGRCRVYTSSVAGSVNLSRFYIINHIEIHGRFKA